MTGIRSVLKRDSRRKGGRTWWWRWWWWFCSFGVRVLGFNRQQLKGQEAATLGGVELAQKRERKNVPPFLHKFHIHPLNS